MYARCHGVTFVTLTACPAYPAAFAVCLDIQPANARAVPVAAPGGALRIAPGVNVSERESMFRP